MDFRKIIKFGKSSYVVSLPKEWVDRNRLSRGDIIYINENENDLTLVPRKIKRKKELKSIELDISKLTPRDIERRIISSYIQNYNIIRVYGKDLRDKVKDVKKAIQNLMALEIMEETTEKIVAKDFLKMEEISVADLLKRMDIITRAMYLDAMKAEDEDSVESIYERDQDVNRIAFLIHRALQYYFENPNVASENGFSLKKLISYSSAVSSIERVADNAKRMSKMLKRVEFDDKQKKDMLDLMKDVYSLYENIMKAFYKEDIEKAFVLANEKHVLMAKARKAYDGIWQKKWAVILLEKLKDTVDCCHSIGRDMYH